MLRSARVLLAALSVGALAQLVVAARVALREDGAHRWSEQNLSWLAVERFAAEPLARAALLAFAAGFLGALVLEVWSRGGRRCAGCSRFLGVLGHPLTVGVALVLAFGGPRLLAASRRPSAPADAPNLLFVLIDTWRADHAGFLGYSRDVTPNLDRLAERGVVFSKVIAQASWTKPSVATLFTGEVPSSHKAVSNPIEGKAVRGVSLPKSRTTFLEVLRGHGWETAAWSANPNVVPARGFAQGTGYFYDGFNDPRHAPDFDPGRSEHLVAAAEAWIDAQAASARPFAAYVHVMDPHYPYAAPPPFGGRWADPTVEFALDGKVCHEFYEGEKDVKSVTSPMLKHVIDSYDEEIAYMDHNVGPFLERVLAAHPDTVVVLVSDHGEEFLEHGQFGHGIGLWQSLVHVPLVLWAPSLAPARVASQVRLMDVTPTLFDLLGLPAAKPRAMQGESLAPVLAGRETADRLAPMECGGDGRPAWQWRGISDGRLKGLVRERDLERWPAPPLSDWERAAKLPATLVFDLENDPAESFDLSEDPERAADAATLFDASRAAGWLVEPEALFSGLAAQKVSLGGRTEALQSLGYAGDDVEKSAPERNHAPDEPPPREQP